MSFMNRIWPGTAESGPSLLRWPLMTPHRVKEDGCSLYRFRPLSSVRPARLGGGVRFSLVLRHSPLDLSVPVVCLVYPRLTAVSCRRIAVCCFASFFGLALLRCLFVFVCFPPAVCVFKKKGTSRWNSLWESGWSTLSAATSPSRRMISSPKKSCSTSTARSPNAR